MHQFDVNVRKTVPYSIDVSIIFKPTVHFADSLFDWNSETVKAKISFYLNLNPVFKKHYVNDKLK